MSNKTYNVVGEDAGPYIGSMHQCRSRHSETVSAETPEKAIMAAHKVWEGKLGILGFMNRSWTYTVTSGSEVSRWEVSGSAGRGYQPVPVRVRVATTTA